MTNSESTVLVLDCTLRDGGYYNAWDFRADLAHRYFRAMEDGGVDAVELGFRSPPAHEYRGPFAYTTDGYLAGLDLPKGPALGVMVNAADLVDDPVATVDALFAPADRSPIGLVRIASHFREVDACRDAVARLRDLGYRVGLNLMQVSTQPVQAVQRTAQAVAAWEAVEVLYVADSLGDMTRSDVDALLADLRQVWPGDLGMHTHDNRSRALDNTLAAAAAGARWLDATVLGMGRGAGNCRTDFLLFELAQQGAHYHPEALLSLSEIDFRELQRAYGWGTSLLYFKSAANAIHPTYVQFMQTDDRYDLAEMDAVLDALPAVGAQSFRTQNLDLAVNSDDADGDGTWSAEGWLDGAEVLILGSGPSLRDHADQVERFIEERQPVVLCLNTSTPVAHDLVDVVVACNPRRLALEGPRLSVIDKPLLAPAKMLATLGTPPVKTVLDYGVTIESGTFAVRPTGCTLPARLAVAYALAVANAGGASRVALVGFDGYPAGDARQEQMVELLSLSERLPLAVALRALTPTTYPVPQGSLYAPPD